MVCAAMMVAANIAAEVAALRKVTAQQFHAALPTAAAAAATVWAGYLLLSLAIQRLYYASDQDELEWKIQRSYGGAGARRSDALAGLWIPLLSTRRPLLQRLFMTVNTITAGLSAGFATMAYCADVAGPTHRGAHREESRLIWAASMAGYFAVSSCYQGVVEYYWHRCMHHRIFYGWCHKHHHAHKSPGPFDDMCIHPLEVRCQSQRS